jgi:hypothetical protein
MSGKSKAAAVGVAAMLPGGGAGVVAPVAPCKANRDPQLKVKVYAMVEGKRRTVQATVTASALTQASAAGTGVADFSYVLPGTYAVTVSTLVAPDDTKYYTTGETQTVTLAQGDKRTLELEVKPVNLVKPKLQVEYKAVVFDRDLAQYQTAAGEAAGDLLRPDATKIEVSLEMSEDAPPYNGGGTLGAPNCSVFLDADCTQPLVGNLTHAQLTASPPLKLYLRGTTRGRFTLSLTLDPSPDARVVVDPPATEDMGVVAIDLEVYQHATAVNVAADTYPLTGHCTDLENINLIPAQVVLSDNDKVRVGRLLHVKVKKNHGRAKAVLKLTAAEWPPGTDDYKIVLASDPSALRAYDAEVDGARQSLPLNSKVGVLRAADQTLWIEGASASGEIRGTRLSVGLDRASGGLSKGPKKNADWARFTVVKIAKVALEYTTPAAGQPQPWNASKRRWYINYQAGDPGRTVTIRAKLSQPIAGITLHFMLSPDKGNLVEKNWGVDLPAAWVWNGITADVKHKDKVNATDLLHKTQDTDAQGQADCDLVLSRFGGDRFLPAAYIAQDPHLAAYVHGHATLEERKPKLADVQIKVWRKFAYQKVKVPGRKYPSSTTAEGVYGRVRAEMLKRPSIHLTTADLQPPALPSLMPEYMFKVNGSKKLRFNASDANQGQFLNRVAAETEHPLKIAILTCDYNWGNERSSAAVANFDLAPGDFPQNVATDALVCDPPVQGGALLVSGTWEAFDLHPVSGAYVSQGPAQPLAAGDVSIDSKRNSLHEVSVGLPAAAGATTATTRIQIGNLVVLGADSEFLGGYAINIPASVVAVFDPKASGDYQNTLVHEVGHGFHQTANVSSANPGGLPPAAGIPVNPLLDPYIAEGGHCLYNTDKCVMYRSGPIPGSLNRYCPNCHPYLLVEDMSNLK